MGKNSRRGAASSEAQHGEGVWRCQRGEEERAGPPRRGEKIGSEFVASPR
ncbi:hypothetical protein [Devosia sp. DBB001]|nr:hypothetical protein [Devosia sp. DBB001]